MSIDEQQRVAANIRAFRELYGLTQTELAERMGLKDKSSISKIESGNMPITLKTVERIAEVFGCPPRSLMPWDEDDEMAKQIKRLSAELEDKKHPGINCEPLKMYYFNDDTAEIAEQIFQDKNLRALFDAAREAEPKDIQLAAEMLARFKRTNPDG